MCDGRLVQLDIAHPGHGELFERGPVPDESAHKIVGRVGQNHLGSVVLDDLRSLAKDRDPVTEFDRLIEVMGDEYDRLAQFLL
ncbi:Uncharacterised protein [Mycobacteroides abscessus]|nr:Uncharacterised protein [Mycobacteroides abscessus]